MTQNDIRFNEVLAELRYYAMKWRKAHEMRWIEQATEGEKKTKLYKTIMKLFKEAMALGRISAYEN